MSDNPTPNPYDHDETYPLNPQQATEDIVEGQPVEDEDETELAPPQPASAPSTTRDTVQEIRSERVRQRGANRFAILPMALACIGLGTLLLAQNYVDDLSGLNISSSAASVVLIGALVLTYIFRFFTSGRRERGLFFLAIVILTWGSVLALSIIDDERYPITEFWPLFFAGVGIAFFLTFLFERSHQVGLVFPGVILLFASGVAFLITQNVVGEEVQSVVEDYWPLLIAFIGLTILPSALQDES